MLRTPFWIQWGSRRRTLQTLQAHVPIPLENQSTEFVCIANKVTKGKKVFTCLKHILERVDNIQNIKMHDSEGKHQSQ